MSDAHDPATLAWYEAQTPSYAASGPGGTSSRLAGFMAALPPGARVLELGCGGGRDAEAMLAAGLLVEPTDGAAAVARMAEVRLGIPVRAMRFEELDAVSRYDGVWASASLLHVPRAGLPGALRRIHAALRPGGLHCATYKSEGTDGRDRDGRYFNHLSDAALLECYRAAGEWSELTAENYLGGGYEGGAKGPWVAIRARRA